MRNEIFATEKFESAESHYPTLYLFDGTDWKTISGDFSNGTTPLGIETIGTDIYYIFGDASSENAIGDPTIIKSKKLTK